MTDKAETGYLDRVVAKDGKGFVLDRFPAISRNARDNKVSQGF